MTSALGLVLSVGLVVAAQCEILRCYLTGLECVFFGISLRLFRLYLDFGGIYGFSDFDRKWLEIEAFFGTIFY